MSGKAMATKSLKEKWLSMVQLAREKGENGIGGSSTVTQRIRETPVRKRGTGEKRRANGKVLKSRSDQRIG